MGLEPRRSAESRMTISAAFRPRLQKAPSRRSLLRPGECLRRRVHLIVVPAIREHRQLMQIVGEPVGLAGQVDEPILDRRGLRVKPHDLVAVRLVARHFRKPGLDELLDQLGARRFILDQDDGRVKQQMLVVNGALEVEVGELLAQDIEKVELRAFDPPGRADGIVRKFCWSQLWMIWSKRAGRASGS